MKKFKKIILIVADSLGIGAAKDAENYGDKNTNTLGHIIEKYPDIVIPNLNKLGIRHFLGDKVSPNGVLARLTEISVGKDTLTGHFEMMGLKVDKPFPSFTDTGFTKELINDLERFSGRKVIGNISASGTEIIKDLGMEQLETGALIVSA